MTEPEHSAIANYNLFRLYPTREQSVKVDAKARRGGRFSTVRRGGLGRFRDSIRASGKRGIETPENR